MNRLQHFLRAKTQFNLHSPFVYGLYTEVLFSRAPGVPRGRYEGALWRLERHYGVAADRPATDLRILFEYGYRLVDRRHWSLTPFVGGGFHILDQSEEDDEFSVSTGTYGGGILLQWRYAMSFDPLGGAGVSRGDFDFSARLSLLHSTFSEIIGKPSGWGVYLQFGIGFGYGSYRSR